MPPRVRYKAVLFDLGNVLLAFDFTPAFRTLSRHTDLGPAEIEGYFIQSGLEVLYDGGKITTRRFFAEVSKALGLRIGYARFRSIWNDIFTPIRPTIRILRRLKARGHRLVLISNTNEMHYRHIRATYDILAPFDRILLSYREKIRKPDPRIYRRACEACRARPEEIFYIDDRADLTQAARALGFKVHTYHNDPARLERDLRLAGLL
ncbi:MAG: Alpha-D-glucose 1-phosphate phosphatase YihX [Candidatus Omnitrophica bacterium]|nr:Alpha-D-glucose 1-phosphate phosphatase YihX [Candidatus Omnitrophota bacterium]